MEDLATLVAANEEAAAAIASAYEVLLGGVPNVAGFTFVINSAIASGIADFNQENIFINVVNSLVQGNSEATAAFNALIAGQATLTDKVVAMYEALVPLSEQTPEGIAFLTRPDALQFYQDAVAERGIAGPNGDAIVALSAVLNVLYSEDIGIGDSVNDLLSAIADGSAQLPLSGDDFTPIEIADGTNYDGDDASVTQLTTGVDNVTGGASSDVFEGNVVQTALLPNQTLNSGDRIDGGGGRDEVHAQLVDFYVEPAELTSIEHLSLENAPLALGLAVGVRTVDAINADAIDEVSFRAPNANIITGLAVTNVLTVVDTVNINSSNGAAHSISFIGDALDGDEDAIEINLNNVANTTLTLNNGAYEMATINSEGPTANSFGLAIAALEQLTINGNQDLTLAPLEIDPLALVDAGEFTGDLNATFRNNVDGPVDAIEVIGGSGNDNLLFTADTFEADVTASGNDGDDQLTFGQMINATASGGIGEDIFTFRAHGGTGAASFDEDDSVDGGADYDELWIGARNGAVLLDGVGDNIVDVERIVHYAGNTINGAITVDMSRSGSAMELELAGGTNGSYSNQNVTVTNLTNNDLVVISGTNIWDLTLDQAVDGVLDNLHIAFVGGADINDDLVVGADIEALDIEVGATEVGNPSVITDADQTDTDLRITGEGDLVIGSTDAYDHLDGLVDASMFTGDLTIHLGGGDQSVIGGSSDDLFVLETNGYGSLLGNFPDVIDLSVGGSDTVQFTSTTEGDLFGTFENALNGTNYHRVVGFDIADDDLEILVGGGGIQIDNTATGASVNNTQDVAILDYVSGTNIDADGLVNYNFIKFTTAIPAAGGNAEAAFDAAIGLGVIEVQDNAEFLASLYDSSRGEMVLFTVDSGADTAINTGDDIDVIGTVAMTYDDYLAFNGSNISFV